MKKSTLYAGIGVAIIVLLGGSWYFLNARPAKLDSFAQCLNDRGAKFYGAFWCPHCADQKALFGRSKRLLPYIECSTPDRRGQTAECTSVGVDSYPTWVFANGERENGVVSLNALAEKTGCILP